jgi:aspartyl-tRNA synthetase
MCGKLTKADVGKAATVMGWAAKRRDFGSLIFVDLRDRTGVVQVVFDESKLDKKTFCAVQEIRNEYVLAIRGTVRKRDKDTINDKLSTGEIEIAASSLKILSEAETPPFAIEENSLVNESTRLKYRYLDLRRPDLSGNLIVRDKISRAARDYFAKNDFLEIETPFLGKSTPEGARDYLVPSRVHNGAFYALPQSPQLYKQLLMIGGFDRYYQIARCFRDEDLRANRQPEFTQIDVEMSFVEDEGDVMNMAEGLVKRIFKDAANIKLKTPFKKMTYREAMDRFGSDKPDTRFGLELINIGDIVKDCGFQVFSGAIKNGGSVRVINAKGFEPKLARRDIDALADFAKTYKAKGLAWIAFSAEGVKSAITKFLSEAELNAIIKRTDAKTGDILFFSADSDSVVFNTLGALRLHLAEGADLINKDIYDILWVTDFPLLEYSEEEKRYVACHHPFTAPKNEDLSLLETAPEKTRAKAYDLVINGQEAGGGSIRIHRVDVQSAMFKALGFSQKQIEQQFGFFVNAFKYGAPPHGGIAFGLDRLTMLLTKTESIKDVVAFPKVQNASCLMTQAPDTVEPKQLKELGLVVKSE